MGQDNTSGSTDIKFVMENHRDESKIQNMSNAEKELLSLVPGYLVMRLYSLKNRKGIEERKLRAGTYVTFLIPGTYHTRYLIRTMGACRSGEGACPLPSLNF